MGNLISIPAVVDLQLHLQAKQTLPDAKNAAAMAALAPKYEQHISELQAGLNTANDRCCTLACSEQTRTSHCGRVSTWQKQVGVLAFAIAAIAA